MADVKPATDADVDRCRNLYSYLARTLAARIDKEIEDRLAAEARVKALEDAGEEAFHVLAGCDCDNGVEHAGMNEGDHHKSLALDRLRALLPALKEPSNG